MVLKRRIRRNRYRFWMALLWSSMFLTLAVTIFMSSGKNGDDSGSMTEAIAIYALDHFTDYDYTDQDIDNYNHTVRKFGHFLGYYLLGITAFGMYRYLVMKLFPAWILGAVTSVLYAASDEWHQTLVDGRSACVLDVMIDSSGVLLAFWTMLVFIMIERGAKEAGTQF